MISSRFGLAAALLAVAVMVPSLVATESASAATAHTFKNCTDVHKTYKAGIAKVGVRYNVIHHTGKASTKKKITGSPKFNDALYKANASKDADMDGIACELG